MKVYILVKAIGGVIDEIEAFSSWRSAREDAQASAREHIREIHDRTKFAHDEMRDDGDGIGFSCGDCDEFDIRAEGVNVIGSGDM